MIRYNHRKGEGRLMLSNVLTKDSQNKELKKLYLLNGEKYLVSKTEEFIKNDFISNNMMADFDFEVINKFDIINFENCIESIPLSGNKLVFIKDIPKDKEIDKTVAFFEKLPDYITIVFILDEIKKNTKLYKRLKKHGEIVELKTPTFNQLTKWVKATAENEDKSISDTTAKFFLNYCDTEMFNLNSEMMKLFNSTENSYIEEKDIKGICRKSIQFNIFNLINAINKKETEKALEIYNEILEEEPPIKILVMLNRQYSHIWQVKTCIYKNMSSTAIQKEIGIKPYPLQQISKIIKNYSRAELKKILNLIFETDLKIKTGQIEAELSIEILINRICGGY